MGERVGNVAVLHKAVALTQDKGSAGAFGDGGVGSGHVEIGRRELVDIVGQ